MDDKELLKLAAKAIGGELSLGTSMRRTGPTWETWEWRGPIGIRLGPFTIYPMINNGDALVVAVKIGLHLTGIGALCLEDGEDELSAARRAIVRAAAEIGKTL